MMERKKLCFYIKKWMLYTFFPLLLLGHKSNGCFTFELKRSTQALPLTIMYHSCWQQNFLYCCEVGVGYVTSSLTYKEIAESMSKTMLFTQLTFGAADGDLFPAGHPWGVQAFLHTSGHVEKRPKWPSASGGHNNGPYPPKVCWGWLAFVLTRRWVRESFRGLKKSPHTPYNGKTVKKN